MQAKLLFRATLAILFGSFLTAQAQTSVQQVEKTFQSPPPDARVMMRWWWFGPAVTRPELLREMRQMKDGGFGGFEIQPVYPLELDDLQAGFRNLPYLSGEFLDDLRFVNQQARQLGLRANITLSSGWPYGGPHTPVTEAAAEIREIRMPIEPEGRSAPLPALGHGEKLLAVFLFPGRQLPLPPVGATRMELPSNIAQGGGTLFWYVMGRTGQQVKRPSVDADGFVLDHFSQKAVQDHLHNVGDKLIAAFGDQPPYSVFSDSLEVYGADWTPDLVQEFRNRFGYDILPHLPELFSVHPDERALEVRHDWGELLTELVDTNYLKPIEAWAAAHHTLFRSQTYGPPAVSLSSNALVDLPEGEGPQWRQFSFTRWATSASHVYGRPVTSSETWTWLHSPAFRATPLDMKAEADRFFLQGINQLMGHGWAYSPPSASEPGWRFYAAGVFNAHNPWWIVMPDVAAYLQRVSWILRQGQPANDIAIFLPEDDAWAAFTPGKVALTGVMPHWITPELTQTIEDAGYNFDYIDGAAIAARGIHYPVLILPKVDRISPSTLALIEQYRQKGGRVIALGRIPGHAPGLVNNEELSKQVAQASHALFDAPQEHVRVVADTAQLGDALHRMLPPDFQLSAAAPAVGFIHRKLPDADLYFIANTSNRPVNGEVRLRSHYGSGYESGEWLDADTGLAHPAVDNHGAWSLDLPPYASGILLLHHGTATDAPERNRKAPDEGVADLSENWQLRFIGTGVEERLPQLVSWIDNPSTHYYSGVAVYRRVVDLPADGLKAGRLILDFGKGTPVPEPAEDVHHSGIQAWFDPPIREAAVIYINGKRVGSLWHPPYELDVTGLLKPGSNELEVRVANTAINELAGESLPDYRLLWARYGRRFVPQDMDHLKPLPSGLLGKVKLLRRSQP